jgi:CheY-like chemotaxis protein
MLVDGLLPGVRVLIVDDGPDEAEMYAFALTKLGARVMTSSSGEEALELLDQHRFDVLVSDITLSGMTGLELIRHLRARSDRTPAIALTGWSGQDGQDEARAAGFDAFCAKPCTPSALAEQIVRLRTGSPSEAASDV